MAELSMFEQHQLAILSPSPSKHEDVAQSTDNVTFECPTLQGDPSLNVTAILTRLGDQIACLDNRVQDLQGQLTGEIQEREELQGQLAVEIQEREELQGQLAVEIQECEELQGQLAVEIQEREELQGQLEGEREERISEQNKLKTRLATLRPVTQRILIDAYLSVKGYRTSLGSRKDWIHSNINSLLPPGTKSSGPAFEKKLGTYCQQGNKSTHSTETLAIALAFSDQGPPDQDFALMFRECFEHSIAEELDGKIPSTRVEIGIDGIAQLQMTPSPVA